MAVSRQPPGKRRSGGTLTAAAEPFADGDVLRALAALMSEAYGRGIDQGA